MQRHLTYGRQMDVESTLCAYWDLHQLDIESAFLNGELKETMYMKQPEGLEIPGKEHFGPQTQEKYFWIEAKMLET